MLDLVLATVLGNTEELEAVDGISLAGRAPADLVRRGNRRPAEKNRIHRRFIYKGKGTRVINKINSTKQNAVSLSSAHASRSSAKR